MESLKDQAVDAAVELAASSREPVKIEESDSLAKLARNPVDDTDQPTENPDSQSTPPPSRRSRHRLACCVAMASAVGWIDASADDERRMREIVRLFSQQESRDELGIEQVLDALSAVPFPVISVVRTRARYAYLVPWLNAHAVTRDNSPPPLLCVHIRGHRGDDE